MTSDLEIYPDKIIICGGGRWARVYLDVLLSDTNCNSSIYILTLYNKIKIKKWLKTKS